MLQPSLHNTTRIFAIEIGTKYTQVIGTNALTIYQEGIYHVTFYMEF